MFLSNRDICWAIKSQRLLLTPPPEHFGGGYDETSIDLHLDKVEEAKIWNVGALLATNAIHGQRAPEVHLGSFRYGEFAEKYLVSPPNELPTSRSPEGDKCQLVCLRGRQVIVKPGGFLLWITKEVVGTPKINPGFICFVDGKSTRARTGIVVHLTAPNIHAGWNGKITLEIANLGPFHLILEENDVIAQLTVASVSSPPDVTLKESESATDGQQHVSGSDKVAPS